MTGSKQPVIFNLSSIQEEEVRSRVQNQFQLDMEFEDILNYCSARDIV